jgi:Tfp pilus assembly protein PilO
MTRKPLMIGVAAIVAVSLVWYALLWSPATNRLHAAEAAKASALATEASLSSQIAGLEVSARKLPAERAADAAVASELPATADIPGFIDQLTSVAEQTGVELTGLSQSVSAASAGTSGAAPAATSTTSGATEISGLGVLAVQFGVSGTYSQTMAFISAVEGLRRFVSIGTLGVSGTTGALNTTVSASAYFDTTPLPKVPKIPKS